jgi:hypothetical protein
MLILTDRSGQKMAMAALFRGMVRNACALLSLITTGILDDDVFPELI